MALDSGGFRVPARRVFESLKSRSRLPQQAGKQAPERVDRQADDVQVVAFDAVDAPRADPLDRIPAGPALPFAGGDVAGDLGVACRREAHRGALAVDADLAVLGDGDAA